MLKKLLGKLEILIMFQKYRKSKKDEDNFELWQL